MTNPFELPKDLLHEVIFKTIELENLSNRIIRNFFDLELKFGGEDENYKILNAEKINLFNEFFLENLGASSRADLLLKVIKDTYKNNEEELLQCKNFKNKLIDFYKIRNIFAHNIYPKDLKGRTRLESSQPYWIELHKQHKALYEELKEFINLIIQSNSNPLL